MSESISISRRNFFKFSVLGGVGAYSMTYSPPSHAFGFTAAAIATGEKLGWATKPYIDAGVNYLMEQFKLSTEFNMQAIVIGLATAGDGILDSINEIGNNQIKLKTHQNPATCALKSNSRSFNYTQNTNTELTKKYNDQFLGAYSVKIPNKINQDIHKAIDHIWNDLSVDDTSISNIEQITELYLHLGYSSIGVKEININSIGWLSDFTTKLRYSLLTAVLNRHQISKISQRIEPIRDYINSTYHSESWRLGINEIPSSVPAAKELLIQTGLANAIAYNLIISKQNILLTECLLSLEEMKR
ncbi:hypothetical protein ACVP6W_002342 [Vibrio cholerae]